MSRSYKHTPRSGERKGKYSKRLANRIVRRNQYKEAFPQYSGYKKMFESWNICDFEIVGKTFEAFYMEERMWNCLLQKPPPDRVKTRNRYERWFIRK